MLKIVRHAFCCRLLLLCFLSPFCIHAQSGTRHYSQQFAVTSENDRYVFKGKDGYYTNGVLLHYTRALQSNGTQKRLNSFELGQKMFLPYDRKIYVPAQIDRPVTGYLYAKYSRALFYTPNSLWQWGLSADVIGEASLARSIQNTFHNWINIDSRLWGWVWDYQLKSQVGVNVHGTYAKSLLQPRFSSSVQFIPVTKATIGTSFTNISQGMVIQAGRLRTLDKSAFWNGAVQHRDEAKEAQPEWVFYYYPELLLQAYNATIQGGLFRNDKGPFTSLPERFVFTHQVGAFFSSHRYLLRLTANFQSKEARSQRFTHSYGTVQVAYRIR